MKKIPIIIIVLIAFALQSKSQILHPVTWSYAAKKTSPTEAVVFFKATIEPGWHVYSQTVKEGGPVKTTITFMPSKTFILAGKTIEPTPVTRMEKAFGMEVSFFENSVIFQQKINLKAKQVTVSGSLEYMTCNDIKCLPPENIDFSIPVK